MFFVIDFFQFSLRSKPIYLTIWPGGGRHSMVEATEPDGSAGKEAGEHALDTEVVTPSPAETQNASGKSSYP